jgi:hypothetical protein
MKCVEHSTADEQKMQGYRSDVELERETGLSTFKGDDNLASFTEASGSRRSGSRVEKICEVHADPKSLFQLAPGARSDTRCSIIGAVRSASSSEKACVERRSEQWR